MAGSPTNRVRKPYVVSKVSDAPATHLRPDGARFGALLRANHASTVSSVSAHSIRFPQRASPDLR